MGFVGSALEYLALLFLLVIGIGALTLLVLFILDRTQTDDAIRRNYPVIGRFRFFFSPLGEFFRQYFFAMDREEMPFNRAQREWVYHSSSGKGNMVAFGSTRNLSIPGTPIFVNASFPPLDDQFAATKPLVIGPYAKQPYEAPSIFNISGMSYGAISRPAVEALSRGAAEAGVWLNTGEGGLSPYHLKHGGDIVWELGSGYFGARSDDGNFDPESFRDKAQHDQVKMTEIKLSQGAKPGHGGLLPAAKVTEEIAKTRQVPANQDCLSPPGHSAFSTPREMLEFAAKMRELSGGKPVGIKLCVGMPHEVFAICKAMLDSGIYIDFIVVDGGGGGTGAAPLELSDHVGLPLRIGLHYVNNALIGTGLKDKIRLAASEKVFSGSAIAMNAALGANWCNAARAFMFSLGCVQSLRCHTGTCPTGVATSSPARQRGLVIPEKAQRVANFQSKTLDSLHDIVVACGLESPDEFTPQHLRQWKNNAEMIPWSQIVHEVEPGKLIHEPEDTAFAEYWRMADPDTFKPAT